MSTPVSPRPPRPTANSPTSTAKVPVDSMVDVRHFFLVFRERWLAAAGLALLACGLLGYQMLKVTPVYTAKAQLLVERSSDRVVDMKQVVDNSVDSGETDALLLTHIEQLQSHSFYLRLVASLSPEEREQILSPYRTPQSADSKAVAAPVAPEDADRALERFLAGNITVARAKRTLIIDITVNHRDPRMTVLLANRMAEQYVIHLSNRSGASNTAAVTFLNTQVDDLGHKVEVAEKNLQAYREKYNLVSVEDNQNVVAERLQALSTSLTQARIARLAFDAKVQQIEHVVRDGTDQLQIAALSEFASLADTQKQIDQLLSQRAVLAERYGKNHPAMQDNARSLDTLGKLRAQYLAAALADLKNQQEKALSLEKQLEQEFAQAEKDSLNLAKLSVDYNILRREVDTTRQTYTSLLARQNETAITSQLQNTNIKVVDRAALPDSPTSPDKHKITLILALLAGVILCGYPLAADTFDDRTKSWHDVENYFGATLLGEIGQAVNVTTAERGLIVAQDSDETVVEAFRGLHSQLLISTKIEPPCTLLITSTTPSEGKSFVSANLAAAFGAHGKRTLLIDCDFRRPSQHRFAHLENKIGVMKWLEKNVPPGPNMAADPDLGLVEIAPRCFLLRTGGSSRRISELLENGNLTSLIEALQKEFEIVILDTPPAGVFPDAEIFARLADEMIYVCRFKGARRSYARQVLRRLLKSDLHFAGVVLNAMPISRSQSYYYSGYGYYYSKEYRKYYQDDTAKDKGGKS